MIFKHKDKFQNEDAKKQMLKASQKFRGAHTKPNNTHTNWMDQLKGINDPESLNDLYIKNLKEEIRLLETQLKILKGKLGLLHNEDFQINSSVASSKMLKTGLSFKQSQVQLGQNSSDFAKYSQIVNFLLRTRMTNTGSIMAKNETFGSSSMKTEYIRELEGLVDELSKQVDVLKIMVSQKIKVKSISVVIQIKVPDRQTVSKFEGHDLKKGLQDQLLIGKTAPLLVKKQNKQIYASTVYADNSLQDRMIQNLLEEKQVIEAEISLYKGLRVSQISKIRHKSPVRPRSAKVRSVSRERMVKMEGHDFQKFMKMNTPSSVIWGAIDREKQSFRHLAIDKEQEGNAEQKYLNGLIQENYLLQHQLGKLKNENKYFNPQNRQEY